MANFAKIQTFKVEDSEGHNQLVSAIEPKCLVQRPKTIEPKKIKLWNSGHWSMDYALLSMTSRIAIDYRMRGENSSVDENLMNLFGFFVCGRIFHDFILNFRLWTKILLSLLKTLL